MAYPALAVANYFILRGLADGNPVDPLKLQKLVYLGHGWNLAVNREPLISENIKAWDHGPVVVSVWQEFKHYGRGEIDQSSPTSARIHADDHKVLAVLDGVWEGWGHMDGIALSNWSHEPDGPWFGARRKASALHRSPTIDDDSIRQYFVRLADQESS